MVSENSVSFKSFLYQGADPEVRRFTIDKDVVTNLSFLKEKLCMIYPDLRNYHSYRVTWKDNEGDWITIGSDEELIIFLTEQTSGVMCIHIFPGSLNINVADHTGVICDVCDGPVTGFRYKCLQCLNFDLCSRCESKGGHSEHYAIRIPQPMDLIAAENLSYKMMHNLNLLVSKKGHQKRQFSHRIGGTFSKKEMKKKGKVLHKMSKKFRKHSGSKYEGGCRKGGREENGGCPWTRARSCGGLAEMLSSLGVADPPLNQPGTSQEQQVPKDGPPRPCSADEFVGLIGAIKQGIASFLDPSGVNPVNMMARNVEQMETEENPEGQKNEQTVNPSDVPHGQKDKGKNEPKTSTPNATSQNQQNDEPQMQSPPQTENINSAGDAGRSSPAPLGWTIIPKAQQLPETTPSPGVPNTSQAAQAPFGQTDPQPNDGNHPNLSRVEEALRTMMSMGFSNDGDWLRQLLLTKEGDIGQVLDLLMPVQKVNK